MDEVPEVEVVEPPDDDDVVVKGVVGLVLAHELEILVEFREIVGEDAHVGQQSHHQPYPHRVVARVEFPVA